MRAMVQRRYGSPEKVLELRNIDRPAVREDEVLIRVRAASLHPDVWDVVHGWPFILRVMGAGLWRPKVVVPGTDAAGEVHAVGDRVARFRPGDEVFGEIVRGHQWRNGGAFAEFAAVPEDKLELKPANVTFEQAAATPTSGLIALRSVRDQGRVRAGHKVLINGAGGAVGAFAVQIARASGATVTGVDAAHKAQLLRSLGAERVIDYAVEDFTRGHERYDLILDIPGNRSFSDLARVLADGGRYVLVGHDQYGASGNRWIGGTIGRFLKLSLFAPFGRRPTEQPGVTATEQPLVALSALLETGEVTPTIDSTFPLEQVPEAIRYLEQGRACGKVVITI